MQVAWKPARRLWVGGLCLVCAAGAQAAVLKYSNDPAKFGKLNQRTIGYPLGDWACAPVSVANSLVFLERQYPNHYQRTLIPEITPDGLIDANEIAAVARVLASPAFMNTQLPASHTPLPPGLPPPPEPYYDPNLHGYVPGLPAFETSGGTTFENSAWGKDKYLRQPGMPYTKLKGQYRNAWTNPTGTRPRPGWLQDNVNLSIDDLVACILDKCDVEIGFTWMKKMGAVFVEQNSGHAVTVHGFEWDDSNNDGDWDRGEPVTKLQFIDPWNDNPVGLPPVENAPDLTGDLTAVGGELFLQYNGGAVSPAMTGMLRGRLKMWLAECPEPASIALLGLLAPAWRRRTAA
jgi:hypothetical protein